MKEYFESIKKNTPAEAMEMYLGSIGTTTIIYTFMLEFTEYYIQQDLSYEESLDKARDATKKVMLGCCNSEDEDEVIEMVTTVDKVIDVLLEDGGMVSAFEALKVLVVDFADTDNNTNA